MVCWKVYPVVNFYGSNVLLVNRVVPTPNPWVVLDPEPYINIHGHSAESGFIREGPSLQLMAHLTKINPCMSTPVLKYFYSMHMCGEGEESCTAAIYFMMLLFTS